MGNVTLKRASLWRDSLKAIKTTFPGMWREVVAASLVMSLLYYAMHGSENTELAQQLRQNPALFKQHPEMMSNYMHDMMAPFKWLFPLCLVQLCGYYFFTVRYLQIAMKNNRPEFSVNGFFYWFGKLLWKYTRPILWCLIPLVGVFIYLRSMVRYQVVSPLAVLRRAPELKTSWDMTEDNWWRIFGNSLMLSIVLFFVPWIILVGLGVGFGVGAAVFHQSLEPSPVFIGISCIIQGGMAGVMMLAYSIYSCTTYRVLIQESRPAQPVAPAAPPVITPPPAV